MPPPSNDPVAYYQDRKENIFTPLSDLDKDLKTAGYKVIIGGVVLLVGGYLLFRSK